MPQSVPSVDSRNLFGDFAKAGPAIRSYFFLNLLDVISAIPDDSSADSAFGRIEWNGLLKNARFRTDILDNPRWEDDERLLSSMGHAHAKFATSRAALVEVKPDFQRLRRYARSADYRAMVSFGLGVYGLADNDM